MDLVHPSRKRQGRQGGQWRVHPECTLGPLVGHVVPTRTPRTVSVQLGITSLQLRSLSMRPRPPRFTVKSHVSQNFLTPVLCLHPTH